MKNILRITASVIITLLVVASCQPRYIILPIPNDPAGEETTITEISSVDELRAFLERGGNGKANVRYLVIDPTTEDLPITVNGTKEIGGALQVGNASSSSAYSINLLAATEEQVNESTAVFYVPSGSEMNLSNLNATISEEAVSKVSALVEVDTGNISLSGVSINVPETVTTAEFSTIKATGNTTSANISISSSENISVFIPDDNNDESLKNEIEESGTEVATPYDVYSLDDIENNLAEYGKARLTDNLMIKYTAASSLPIPENTPDSTEYIIDLNMNTLTIDAPAAIVFENQNVKFLNGNIEMPLTSVSYPPQQAIELKENATVTLDKVYFHTPMTGILVYENAASLNIINNSTIAFDGAYGISTNAEIAREGISITIKDSHIIGSENGGYVGILFNINGKLDISNSEIQSTQQGVIARGGNIIIRDNSYIHVTGAASLADEEYHLTGYWGSGNAVPCGALVVGNYTETEYEWPTKVTVENSRIQMDINAGKNDKSCTVYIAQPESSLMPGVDRSAELIIDDEDIINEIFSKESYRNPAEAKLCGFTLNEWIENDNQYPGI